MNASGYTFSGAKKAVSKDQLNNYLNSKGVSEYTVFESNTSFGRGMYSLVSCAEISLLCKQISIMLSSYMTMSDGILLLAEQNDNKTLKILLSEICDIMDEGYSFSAAINMYTHIFPTHLVYMVIIGEQSETLSEVFQDLSDYYAKEAKLRKKIKRAVAYPVILGILIGGVILLLIIGVLPVFYDILTDIRGELPAATTFMLGVSNFLARFIFIIGILICAAIGGFIYYVKTDPGKIWYDKFKLSFVFTRYICRRIITAKTAKSLAMLLRSGASFLEAMEIITPLIDNRVAEEKFTNAAEELREGRGIGEVFEGMDIFPPLFIRMLVMGHEMGKTDEMLFKAKDLFDDEVDDAIERLTIMIEPVLIIILSIIVGIILISVMLPIIDLMAIIS